ncbi:MAG: sigma factor-like helix-turn-helix DNA-binding protein [Planctomycetota bacterium]
MSRIELLSGMDKVIMTMYLVNGNTFRQIAQLMGVNETNVSRRIRRLIRRISDGGYMTCLRNRGRFSREELDIAREYFLLGWSMKRIARERKLTFYRARKMVKRIEAVVRVVEHKEEACKIPNKGVEAEMRGKKLEVEE